VRAPIGDTPCRHDFVEPPPCVVSPVLRILEVDYLGLYHCVAI
jgi:hypothetical protein